jgi:hypothetical protein
MADKKISALTASTTPLAGTEVLPIVQSGSTVKVAVSDLTAGRAVSAASLALTGSALPVGSGGTGTATAFATGSVIFSGASGVYSEDNGQLFWDNTNNRLGIGNSTPVQMLDVTGVGRFGSLGSKINIGLNGDSISSDADMYVQTSTANFISFRTNFTEAVRLETNQDVKVSTGNLVIGTAGKGIDFSANTHAAGMTSELLTWYEEGVFTPVFNNLTVGDGLIDGRYTRIGRMVTVTIRLEFGSTSAWTGICANVAGLPFVSIYRANGAMTMFQTNIGWFGGQVMIYANNSQLSYPTNAAGDQFSATTPWVWSAGDFAIITISYEA